MSYHTKGKTYTTERLYRYLNAIAPYYTRIAEKATFALCIRSAGAPMFKLSERSKDTRYLLPFTSFHFLLLNI